MLCNRTEPKLNSTLNIDLNLPSCLADFSKIVHIPEASWLILITSPTPSTHAYQNQIS